MQYQLHQRFLSADAVMEALGITSQIETAKPPIKNSLWECLHTLTGDVGELSCVNTLAFSSDDQTLITGADVKIIRIWDLNTKKIFASLSGHT